MFFLVLFLFKLFDGLVLAVKFGFLNLFFFFFFCLTQLVKILALVAKKTVLGILLEDAETLSFSYID
jgi:hypothetical protein